MKRRSLRSRLVVIFCLLITLAWVISASISYVKTRHRIRYIFDAQQLVFAQRLEDSNLEKLLVHPSSSALLNAKQSEFQKANDALAFAIFDANGKILLTDRPEDSGFSYDPSFIDNNEPTFRDSDKWRILWHQTADRRFIIAVGQENAYRNKLTGDIILDHQVMPWLMILPVLILVIIFMINRELSPINQVSRRLRHRLPDDRTPIEDAKLPLEIQPLIDALNALFKRISSTIERERSFVSDAAHELRSPLAALQVQTEVAQISAGKPEVQNKALHNLTVGIQRASRLVEQLLTLSKLDTFSALPDKQSTDWQQIIDGLINDMQPAARQKKITLTAEYLRLPEPQSGNTLLLSLMMRNLLDNALRYTPEGGTITVIVSEKSVRVLDNGPGADEESLVRIGQRFFRPPGQKQTGSGLGLSIGRRIAELHGFTFTFGNRDEGGFYGQITF
jgi:two-component system sensor histidine kinase QseC